MLEGNRTLSKHLIYREVDCEVEEEQDEQHGQDTRNLLEELRGAKSVHPVSSPCAQV